MGPGTKTRGSGCKPVSRLPCERAVDEVAAPGRIRHVLRKGLGAGPRAAPRVGGAAASFQRGWTQASSGGNESFI